MEEKSIGTLAYANSHLHAVRIEFLLRICKDCDMDLLITFLKVKHYTCKLLLVGRILVFLHSIQFVLIQRQEMIMIRYMVFMKR